MVTVQFFVKTKTFKSDSREEYISSHFTNSHQLKPLYNSSCPFTPSQNSVAECKHRHLLDAVHALSPSSIPICFRGESILIVIHLINWTLVICPLRCYSLRETVAYKTKQFWTPCFWFHMLYSFTTLWMNHHGLPCMSSLNMEFNTQGIRVIWP